MSLHLPDSGADTDAEGRRHAPSAVRNAGPILALLQQVLPPEGQMLELASGTGQHARAFSDGLPGWHWQPSDLNPENLTSICAWSAGQDRIAPPLVLDAGRPGWHLDMGRFDAALVVNLLHLISDRQAAAVLAGLAAVAPRLVIYGPFLREAQTTSPGDAAFHASLRAQDPAIGYKDLGWVADQLRSHGHDLQWHEMPANNLALVTFTV